MKGHRFFAAIYDRLMAGTEDAGLGDMRAQVVGSARGDTLELGAGTGLNLPHYGDGVTALTMAEPDPFMTRRLRDRLESETPEGLDVRVVEATAEDLPFPDDSFDTVVSTLVLCSVEDPDRATAEAARVLRPGGRLLYLEHVRSDSEGLAKWQDRLERPWGLLAAGCHPNRPTAATLARAGFALEGQERDELPKSPPLVRPLIRGSAQLTDSTRLA
jgi:ubiquinone/menaquinone biosynthesis C-methylase UbiE